MSNMQIFKDTKKYVTGITYKDKIKDSIIIPDNSEEAIKIQEGYKFDIIKGKIEFTGEQEIIKNEAYYLKKFKEKTATIEDIQNYLLLKNKN